MLRQLSLFASVAAALAFAGPAGAQVSITQAKAQAGNVTPGDAAGFPVTLSASGSYRLDSNLTVPSNVNGIQVQAANVTIDLNGFTIEGNGVATAGIFGNSVANTVTVRNGTIQRMRQNGIYATRTAGSNWTVDRVNLLGNGRDGVFAGKYLSVTSSRVGNNGVHGIEATDGTRVDDTDIFNNGSQGIGTGDRLIVSNSRISDNGTYGIAAAADLQVTGSQIVSNGTGGIATDENSGALVQGNVISRNQGVGVSFYEGLVTHNDFVSNADVAVEGRGDSAIGGNMFQGNKPPQYTGVVVTEPNACGASTCP